MTRAGAGLAFNAPRSADTSRAASALLDDPVSGDATEVRLYGDKDFVWISDLVDQIQDSVGQPWRVLRERLEHGPFSAPRINAILGALRRVTGGRAERAKVARRIRKLVLGHPALDDAARTERLSAAAQVLAIEVREVESLLWIDLANERPVTLPYGRPEELRLAAFANLDTLQRLVRRTRELRLRVWGDAHGLVRMAARCGLLSTVRIDGDATVLDVIGPLQLFHATSVYGRALAALIPLLADLERFELELRCDFGHRPASFRVTSPALLPPAPSGRGKLSLAARVARDLGKATSTRPRGVDVTLDPDPIASGAHLLFPDLSVRHHGTTWWIEILGFATADYVNAKLARYRAAGITNVILCIDEQRAPEALPVAATTNGSGTSEPAVTHVLGFSRTVPAAAVLEIIAEAA